jgi:hypothetical protein
MSWELRHSLIARQLVSMGLTLQLCWSLRLTRVLKLAGDDLLLVVVYRRSLICITFSIKPPEEKCGNDGDSYNSTAYPNA